MHKTSAAGDKYTWCTVWELWMSSKIESNMCDIFVLQYL